MEMSKGSGSRNWCGYCYRVEHTLKNLPKTSPLSAGGSSDGQEISGLWGIVWLWLDFAFKKKKIGFVSTRME